MQGTKSQGQDLLLWLVPFANVCVQSCDAGVSPVTNLHPHTECTEGVGSYSCE